MVAVCAPTEKDFTRSVLPLGSESLTNKPFASSLVIVASSAPLAESEATVAASLTLICRAPVDVAPGASPSVR